MLSWLNKRLFLICLLLFVACVPLYAQSGALRFEHISLEDGISDIRVTAILQDSKGFMWFGTHNGLNRFDGYNYTQYYHDPLDASSIAGNQIEALYEDRLGNIWIGTSELCRYDPQTDAFVRYTHDPKNPNSPGPSGVASICESSDGYLWFGHWGGGVSRLDLTKGFFKRFAHDPKDTSSLTAGSVFSIYEDRRANLWIGSGSLGDPKQGGLNLYQADTESFLRFEYDPDKQDGLQNKVVLSTFEDSRGNFWVGTMGDGLHLMDREKGTFTHYPYNPQNENQLSGPNFGSGLTNAILSIQEDQRGRLWIAGFGGFVIYDPDTDLAIRYTHEPENPNSLSQTFIYKMTQDRFGNFWMGDGSFAFLDKVSTSPSLFQEYKEGPGKGGGLVGNQAYCLEMGPDRMLWVGTEKGINLFDPIHQQFSLFIPAEGYVRAVCRDQDNILWYAGWRTGLLKYDILKARSLEIPNKLKELDYWNAIDLLYLDLAGDLWIGSSNGGLNRYDQQRNQLQQYTFQGLEIGIIAMLEDQKGQLWASTLYQGLLRYDKDSDRFVKAVDVSLWAMFEDQKGDMWLGTDQQGLWKYDPVSGQSEIFTEKDGLASNTIFSIAEDSAGILWLATAKKLSSFKPEEKRFRNYDANDGLFNRFGKWQRNSVTQGLDGSIYFGGANGLSQVLPHQQQAQEVPPQIHITQLQTPTDTISLTYQKVAKLAFSHDQNTVLIEYVGLHFNNPAKNTYQYWLEGEDDNWVEGGTERKARYTNLKPGSYTFHVKAASSEGLWSEEAKLGIVIHAPWWATSWAYLIYGVLLVGLILGIIQWRTISLRRQRQLLRKRVFEQTQELRKAKETAEVAKQAAESANEAKSTFLSTVSHELRTPLTSIIGFTQLNKKNLEGKVIPDIKEDAPKALKAAQRISKNLEIVSSEGERLTSLINELLDLAKIESGKMEWQMVAFRPAALIERAQNATAALFTQKPSLQLITAVPNDLPQITGDSDRLLQVLINLISNAVKFTDSGTITVGAACKPPLQEPATDLSTNFSLLFTVADTGSGIPADQLDKVFERFQQVEDNQAGKPKGTGLGLPICKQIVEHHGGKIWVESDPDPENRDREGKGSTFSFSLPIHQQEELLG